MQTWNYIFRQVIRKVYETTFLESLQIIIINKVKGSHVLRAIYIRKTPSN